MKKITIVIATLILLSSCEKTITVEVPAATPKLVMNGLVNANSIFEVKISKSETVLSTNSNPFKISNATVLLYENGIYKDSFLFNASKNSYVARAGTTVATGKKYLLTASLNGYTKIEAETTTPSSVTIQSITRRVNARTDANGNKQDELKIKFLDNPTENNNYIFKIKKPVFNNGATIIYDAINCIRSVDVDIDRGSNTDPSDLNACFSKEFIMTDKNFNGRTKEIVFYIDNYELEIFTNPFDQKKYKAIIEMNSVTADHYKYRKSIETYRDNEDNPFAEPVLVYSNVKNGYGIFSSFTMARDTIR